MALVGTSLVPSFLQRSVLAQATSAQAQGKKLVVIFQRGAADGLNIVVPFAEPNYYQFRPTIAIPQNQLINLDGFLGLHPAIQRRRTAGHGSGKLFPILLGGRASQRGHGPGNFARG